MLRLCTLSIYLSLQAAEESGSWTWQWPSKTSHLGKVCTNWNSHSFLFSQSLI